MKTDLTIEWMDGKRSTYHDVILELHDNYLTFIARRKVMIIPLYQIRYISRPEK